MTPSDARVQGGDRDMRRLWPLVALWALPLAVVGISFPLAVAGEAQSVAPEEQTFITVGEAVNDYRTAVVVEFALGEAPDIRSQASGLVTGVSVGPGPVETGQQLITVNNVPVLAFRASAPLYRDLEIWDEGPDVALLEGFLASLGVLPPEAVDGKFDWTTKSAVHSLQETLGVDPDGTFRLSYVAFIPETVSNFSSVNVSLGDAISSGSAVMTGAQPTVGVSIRPEGDGVTLEPLAGNPLVLRFGMVEIPLSGLPIPTEEVATAVDSIRAAVAQGTAQEETGEDGLSANISGGVLSLTNARSAAVVPTTSILVASSGASCVFELVDGAPHLKTRKLEGVEPAPGLIGSTFVPASMVGLTIARDVQDLPSETLALCE